MKIMERMVLTDKEGKNHDCFVSRVDKFTGVQKILEGSVVVCDVILIVDGVPIDVDPWAIVDGNMLMTTQKFAGYFISIRLGNTVYTSYFYRDALTMPDGTKVIVRNFGVKENDGRTPDHKFL